MGDAHASVGLCLYTGCFVRHGKTAICHGTRCYCKPGLCTVDNSTCIPVPSLSLVEDNDDGSQQAGVDGQVVTGAMFGMVVVFIAALAVAGRRRHRNDDGRLSSPLL